MISRNHLLVKLLESVRIVVHRYAKISGTTSLIKVEVQGYDYKNKGYRETWARVVTTIITDIMSKADE